MIIQQAIKLPSDRIITSEDCPIVLVHENKEYKINYTGYKFKMSGIFPYEDLNIGMQNTLEQMCNRMIHNKKLLKDMSQDELMEIMQSEKDLDLLKSFVAKYFLLESYYEY